ncbi:UDP-N-acetylmuramate:L-alanyl-gamma-D-glutamyl-meso-diaminopimelate ligase [Zymobacter sp. IVIA_5232.4 C2]|uniref:UDP-N-acetylmuramate:L-alanyl-gamma-D-glutamyl- meso-diaminopimelate ligase n=1 Tax=Zymobacter sp. IVIA_5232.4 C2 TaxID=3394855 RepID=UPI0039C29270
MHIHILGICGTFMGSLARLARDAGHHVTGSDAHVYPPMSTQLEDAGIHLIEGYSADNLEPTPDLVVIGNAMSRGNPEVEAVLNRRLPYTSGPQWLRDHILGQRQVLAVAGTHGKTTTTSMLAWILSDAGLNPGFLVGGVPLNLGVSSALGDANAPFVVEADEYDSAFFDKRSKFVHYRPDVAVLNNLEFDHADIFPDLAAIERQFHHLVRTVPGNGRILQAAGESALARVIAQGCWTPVEQFGAATQDGCQWQYHLHDALGQRFTLSYTDPQQGTMQADVQWALHGEYNVRNALAAAAAAYHAGVSLAQSASALSRFKAPRRRQEVRGVVNDIAVIDDFAHHPTAVALTLASWRAMVDQQGHGRVLAVLEPRSNTMKMGALRDRLAASVDDADLSFWYRPAGLGWSLEDVTCATRAPAMICDGVNKLVDALVAEARPGDRIVVMSNGGFENIHQRLLDALAARHS